MPLSQPPSTLCNASLSSEAAPLMSHTEATEETALEAWTIEKKPRSQPRSQQLELLQTAEQWQFDPASVAHEGDYVILDTETTGLDHKTESLLEIGAIRFDATHTPVARFSLLVRPDVPIRPSSQKVHNISPEMVEEAPTVAEAIAQFEAFAGDCPYVAHNVVFDYSFLTEAYKKYLGKRFLNPRICSLELFKSVFPEEDSHSLSSLLARFGYESFVSHRALDDAENLGRVYPKLRALYLQKNQWKYSQLPNVPYLLERYLRLQKAAQTLQSEMGDLKDIFKLYFMEGGTPVKASTGEVMTASLKRQYEYDHPEVLARAEEQGVLRQVSKVNLRAVDKLIHQLERLERQDTLSPEAAEALLSLELQAAARALSATRTGMTQQWSVTVAKPIIEPKGVSAS
ncbi:MAG: PolC-type DNA polymerase III [Vampirovibrionales bacterium]